MKRSALLVGKRGDRISRHYSYIIFTGYHDSTVFKTPLNSSLLHNFFVPIVQFVQCENVNFAILDVFSYPIFPTFIFDSIINIVLHNPECVWQAYIVLFHLDRTSPFIKVFKTALYTNAKLSPLGSLHFLLQLLHCSKLLQKKWSLYFSTGLLAEPALSSFLRPLLYRCVAMLTAIGFAYHVQVFF